ncbi:hypothetical protein L1887_21733 [Cichorium endivia]|nr:hypothetical protein L1887_21733 [Cichorium endivia]
MVYKKRKEKRDLGFRISSSCELGDIPLPIGNQLHNQIIRNKLNFGKKVYATHFRQLINQRKSNHNNMPHFLQSRLL